MVKIHKTASINSDELTLYKTARFAFRLITLLGVIEIFAYIFDQRLLLSFNEHFIPIAPDTAIIFIVLGSLFNLRTKNSHNNFLQNTAIALFGTIAIYTILKILEALINVDLTFSKILLPSTEFLGTIQLKRISPITSLIILLASISGIISYSPVLKNTYKNFSAYLGTAVLISGFTITTAYTLGTPIFYIGSFIPVALPTAIGLTFLGAGIVALTGEKSVINRLYTGKTIKSLLIRSFIPIIIVSVLLNGFIHSTLLLTFVNAGLFASISTIFLIGVTIYISVRLAGQISIHIDTADKERDNARDRLSENLKEKETLIKELNHRVKNNFNLINSIISLSSVNCNDVERMKSTLEMVKLRINSIAMVHIQLYESNSLTYIEFKDYIIKLAKSLHQAYYETDRIKFNFEIEDKKLPVNIAIPCSLILTELIVNSIKYAFSDSDEGIISISFKRINENYNLKVSDNGSGLPENFEQKSNESMGFIIIRELCDQLDGNYRIDSVKGTCFEVNFPVI